MTKNTLIFAFSLILMLTSRVFFTITPWQTLVSLDLWLDDSFYYLKLARNWIELGQLSLDGVTRTNGFQPLYLILIAPIVGLLRDTDSIVASINILASLLCLSSVYLIYRSLKEISDQRTASVGALIFSTSPYFLVHTMNGMETGLVIFCVSLFIFSCFVRPFKKERLNNLLLGIAAGLLVLSRIDQLILIVSIVVGFYAFGAKPEKMPDSLNLRQIALPLSLVVLPWYTYVFIETGSLLPQSGEASRYCALSLGLNGFSPSWQGLLSHLGIDATTNSTHFYILVALRQIITFLIDFPLLSFIRPDLAVGPFADPFNSILFAGVLGSAFQFIAVLVVILLVIIFGVIQLNKFKNPSTRVFLGAAFIYFILQAVGYIYYAPVHWYFSRYLAPMQLLMMMSFLIIISRYQSKFLEVFKCVACLLIVSVNLKLIFPVISLHNRPLTAGGFYAEALELDGLLPPGEKVGVFQAGILSWFSEAQIVNLDGKANSQALGAIRQQRLGSYVLEQNIDYIYDWPSLVASYFRDEKDLLLNEMSPNSAGRMRLFEVVNRAEIASGATYNR